MRNYSCLSRIGSKPMQKQLYRIFSRLLSECSEKYLIPPAAILQHPVGLANEARRVLIGSCLQGIRISESSVWDADCAYSIKTRKLSDNEVAALCGVARTTVLRIRNVLLF